MSKGFVCTSGGFDCLHVGHIEYLKESAKFGKLIVILNSDEWLKRKKGFIFMPYAERKHILEELRCVHSVEDVDDADGTVCKALERLRPDYFAKGGDRNKTNTPEQDVCSKLGITVLWGIGGDKQQSSSKLVAQSWDSLLGHLE